MNIQDTNWQAVFFDFLVAGLVIFAVFRLLQYLLPVVLFRKRKNRSILRSLPVMETVIWLLFFSWYMFRFAEIMSIYAFIVAGILLTLIYWISRFFIKDLIAGMFFRVSAEFREGEVIIHNNITGTIKKFRLQSLEIETQEGQIIYIPYSKLTEVLNIKQESSEQSAAYTFSFKASRLHSPEETIQIINGYLVSLPWSSVHKKPVAAIRELAENHYTVEVITYPIEKTFARKIEQRTLDKFGFKE